ncbi:MAG: hypothetical protein PHH82_01200 [Candidatus ainarchaeum sp.]|nr:hypothetical protein [Candidatus ainarchaeum sp.]
MYSGPIIFIVHSPARWWNAEEPSKATKKAIENHNNKMLALIRFANRHNLPVLFGYSSSEAPKEIIDKIRAPVPIQILGNGGWTTKIRDLLEQHQIKPNKVLVAGHYKEICMYSAEMSMRYLFPHSEIIELRQNFSLSARPGVGFREDNVKRAEEKERREIFRVKRAKLARKVLK